jgi:predicted transcriptional regulator
MAPDNVSAANDAASPDLLALTAHIVTAYVTKNSVPAGQLAELVERVHGGMQRIVAPPAPEPEPLVPPVPIKKSVTPDHLISLEDGKPYKTLARHLTGRGLTPDQYRRKWGLPPDYPMVAANYAAQRAAIATANGLGQARRKASAERAGAAE